VGAQVDIEVMRRIGIYLGTAASDAWAAKSVLQRCMGHSIAAGRSDVELVPASQRRCVSQRETLKQRRVPGNRARFKPEDQFTAFVAVQVRALDEMARINKVAVEWVASRMKFVRRLKRVLAVIRLSPNILKVERTDCRIRVVVENRRILDLQFRH